MATNDLSVQEVFGTLKVMMETLAEKIDAVEKENNRRFLILEGKNTRRDSVLNAIPEEPYAEVGNSSPGINNAGGGPAPIPATAPTPTLRTEPAVVSLDTAVDETLKMTKIYPRVFAKTVRICAQYNQEHKSSKRLVFL